MIKFQQEIIENIILKRIPDLSSSSILNNIKLLTSTFPIIIRPILFMGLNQTKSISMGRIWNTGRTEMVISVPVSVLGQERAGTEMGCIRIPLITLLHTSNDPEYLLRVDR